MVDSGSCFKRRSLPKYSSAAIFLEEYASSDLPTGCKCGDVLLGLSIFVDGGNNLVGLEKEPDSGFPVKFIVGNNLKKKDGDDAAPKIAELPDGRSANVKMEEVIRSLKVEELNKLLEKSGNDDDDDDEVFDEVYAMSQAEYHIYILVLMAGLKYYDHKDWREKSFSKAIDAADEVITLVDESELAMRFGMIHDTKDPA